ncbi:hypothetical protein pb186bvf_005101 [Paramecium bursaria]
MVYSQIKNIIIFSSSIILYLFMKQQLYRFIEKFGCHGLYDLSAIKILRKIIIYTYCSKFNKSKNKNIKIEMKASKKDIKKSNGNLLFLVVYFFLIKLLFYFPVDKHITTSDLYVVYWLISINESFEIIIINRILRGDLKVCSDSFVLKFLGLRSLFLQFLVTHFILILHFNLYS